MAQSKPLPGTNQPYRKRTKPHDWTDSAHDPVRGERAMWVAVITQAMMDALSRSNKIEEKYHQHEAQRWLTGGSKDFRTVCHLAGFDPDYIRTRVKRALASPRQWRAEAGKGSRYEERRAYRNRVKMPAAHSMAHSCAIIRLPADALIA